MLLCENRISGIGLITRSYFVAYYNQALLRHNARIFFPVRLNAK
jgi:hypothetical protein